jgi:acyl-CoA thioester hydrolase
VTAGPFVHRLRVRFVECDMQGIVFNAHYVTWMDIAHTELWRAAVGPLADFQRTGLDFVTAEVACRYLSPARFDDEVDIVVRLDPLTTTSMTSHHTVTRDGTTLAEGRVRHVCVSTATMAKAPWPDAIRDATARYVVV